MTSDRDRLIELILGCDKDNEVLDCFQERPKKRQSAEIIADYLLANDVFLLPEDLRGTEDFSISAFIEAMQMYKEKDLYIKTPCKVGDYIWFIQNDRLVLGLVQNITVNNNGSLFAYVYEIDEHNEIENEWSIPLCDFGKTVFLTKEEAEEKLKELKDNGNL